MQVEYHVIDASNQILGRLASQVAKRALLGEHIIVTNAQDAVISGSRKEIIKRERALQNVRTRFNPRRGPFHPSRPDGYLRQAIRGMLPKTKRGREALTRVHVFITGIPEGRKSAYPKTSESSVKQASIDRLRGDYIPLVDLCMQLGGVKYLEGE